MTSARRVIGLCLALVALTGCQAEPRGEEDDNPTPRPPASAAATPEEPSPSPEEVTGARVTKQFLGMHDARVTQGVLPDVPLGSLRLWDTGTTWLQVETAPGQLDWTAVDAAVDTAESRGLKPLLVLGQTPTFHASRPAEQAFYGDGAASVPDPAAWRTYVTAAARRYGDRIEYQVWNEANVTGFWSGTPSQMVALTQAVARVLEREAPKATLVAPAFAMRLGGQRAYFEKFWQSGSRTEGFVNAVDVASVNLYPAADKAPEAQVELYGEVRRVLDEVEVDAPVWNTEINYGLDGSTYDSALEPAEQRAFVLRTYLLNAGLGIERVYWYSWALSGIVNTYMADPLTGVTSPAGLSFALLEQWLVGARVSECEQSAEVEGAWSCEAQRGGQQVTFWWKPGRPADVRLPGQEYRTADGDAERCRSECRLRLGGSPVLVIG